MLPISHPVLKQGDVLEGKYVLRNCIGKGGMGSIFLADQPALERMVAIKVLRPELVGCPAHIHRIREEAIAACHVQNTHCLAILDCSALPDGTPYIVMKHVPGRPLGQIIAEESIPLARAAGLIDQILKALGATHDSGIIHADVKSDNFLVELVGRDDHVTMIDFGLARVAGSPVDMNLEDGELMIFGTPEYMAPEVAKGEPPVRASDLYGAGVILYELLTGATPFGGSSATEIMLRHAHDDVVPPSLLRPDRGIPPALDHVVLRALDKRPEARFADAAAFARAVWAAVSASRASSKRPVHCRTSAMFESPTRSTPLPRERTAQDTDHGANRSGRGAPLDELRRAIGKALVRGDVAQIANGYLELAGALGNEGRFTAAAGELQEGIDLLTAGRGPDAIPISESVDRLIVALAALYAEASERQLTRRANDSADHCPTLRYARSQPPQELHG